MKAFAILISLLLATSQSMAAGKTEKPMLRVATYNTSLYSDTDGGLIARLKAGDDNARRIASVIQHQRPDLLLLNEFDYDQAQVAADTFQHNYLEVGQFGQAPIRYPYRYLAPVNTGLPSGMDLDRNGKVEGGNDAFGFGLHPGQYGMLVLSRYPIDAAAVRSFQKFAWKDLPGAKSPVNPANGEAWYPAEIWAKLRLSSKSHWDVPVKTPIGLIHFLVHHPTPPVFDGPEDRNGIRNHDEIRLWAEYISPGSKPWLCDDQGHCGGLAADARFVIAGDHNADPIDGDSTAKAVQQLLEHPRILHYPAPRSEGAVLAAQRVGGGNLTQKGPAATDTGDFGAKVGNLRLDYVLPSLGLKVKASGVFWPAPGKAGADWIDATDHHMVWVDLTR
jgi:endonuclease/exonuclease/phosphatase family metal-dependent hydrolase